MWFRFRTKKKTYRLDEVFGIASLSADRPSVVTRQMETRISEASEESVHVVLYGPSKQGKSWIVSKHFPRTLRVGCSSKSTAIGLLDAALNTLSGHTETTTEVSGGIQLKALHAEAKRTRSNSMRQNLEMTEIITRIQKSGLSGHIILDNFHFLPSDEKKILSPILRELNDTNIRLVIVGIWQGHSDLDPIVGDLSGRIRQFSVDNWSDSELKEIANKGSVALNIFIDDTIIVDMIRLSARNVGIFQAILKYYCSECGIRRTLPDHRLPGLLYDRGPFDRAIKNCYEESISQSFFQFSELAKLSGCHRIIVSAMAEILRRATDAEGTLNLSRNGLSIDEVRDTCFARFPGVNVEELGSAFADLNTRQGEVLASPAIHVDSNRGRIIFLDQAILAAREMALYSGVQFLHTF